MGRLLVLLALLAPILTACSESASDASSSPLVIRMGVLPDQSEERVRQRYMPLVEYLESTTTLDIELVGSESYTDLREKFVSRDVELANFGGLTFTQAEAAAGAEPLILRDTDVAFTSCYIVLGSDPRESVEEFAGEAFSFGPRLSTSGHLMPRHFMGLDGITPEEEFESVRHSESHDQTAEWVRDGVVTLGVVNCVILDDLLREGRLAPDEIRVLETTPTYGNYVWAVQPTMPEDVRRQLRDAFLALDATVPEHRALLQSLGANGYLPAGSSDFTDVRLAAHALNLIQEVGAD